MKIIAKYILTQDLLLLGVALGIETASGVTTAVIKPRCNFGTGRSVFWQWLSSVAFHHSLQHLFGLNEHGGMRWKVSNSFITLILYHVLIYL
jgi:hypothetical protein